MTAKTTTTTTLPLCELERIMEDGTRGVRQYHVEEEKEKNRKVMVSRTPGGGMQRGRALAASNQCCDDANRAHDEHVHVRSDRTGVVTTGGPAHKPSQG